MRASQFFLPTLKETPAEAELVSHQLLLRGGFIRRLSSGLYTWLPLGLRVLRRVETIVREEMDRTGAQEVLMPVVQPAELWEESGRWEQYGPELLRIQDRHQRDFCLGPTHEEVISDLARREIRSYRQLPINLYQIQTKFRDEIRPRFGLMRAREFIMKDAYSFHLDADSLNQTYGTMYDAYGRIFTRLGLDFRAVEADTGAIGGKKSHEFHVLADSGEDSIVFCGTCSYAANRELATSSGQEKKIAPTQGPAQLAETPDSGPRIRPILIIADGEPVLLLLQDGDEPNLVKAGHILDTQDVRQASPEEVRDLTGVSPEFLGPKDTLVSIRTLVDHRVESLQNFCTGANQEGRYWTQLNWHRDLDLPPVADLRNVGAGDTCPQCGTGILQIRRGIEVGHVFQLGTRYSTRMHVTVQNEKGHEQTLVMGCYGIGVSRVVAAAVEQYSDERGICWPTAMAPFDLGIVAINARKSMEVLAAAIQLHDELETAGYSVLLDDRDERPGVQFATLDLIGLPHRVVVSEKALAQGILEYRSRRSTENEFLPKEEILARLYGEN